MYDVIQGATLEQLVQNVGTVMETGFIPIGGVQFVQYYGTYIFMQAVLKPILEPIDNWYGKTPLDKNPDF